MQSAKESDHNSDLLLLFFYCWLFCKADKRKNNFFLILKTASERVERVQGLDTFSARKVLSKSGAFVPLWESATSEAEEK